MLTEPELGEPVRAHLTRMRLRAQCEIEAEEHRRRSSSAARGSRPTSRARSRCSTRSSSRRSTQTSSSGGASKRASRAGAASSTTASSRPRPGSTRRTSLRKGCYPGQEPIARLHYRGKANRALRVLELADVPPYDAELVHDGKVVGRVTSAVRRPDGSVVALGYVASRCRTTRGSSSHMPRLEKADWWAVRRAQN